MSKLCWSNSPNTLLFSIIKFKNNCSTSDSSQCYKTYCAGIILYMFRIHLCVFITFSNLQPSWTHSSCKPRLLRIFPRISEASFFVRNDIPSLSDSDFVSTPQKKICRSHRCTCHWQIYRLAGNRSKAGIAFEERSYRGPSRDFKAAFLGAFRVSEAFDEDGQTEEFQTKFFRIAC